MLRMMNSTYNQNSRLKQLITPSSVESYSKACIDLWETLMDLRDDGYQRLIIPSRGIYPFYSGALQTAFILGGKKEFSRFHLNFSEWLLPFTSDWGDADIEVQAHQIRRFWTKVMADGIRDVQTPYSQFYSAIIETVGSRYNINTSQLSFDSARFRKSLDNENFIFIDTAISGKAICDIIESMSEFNLNSYHIIVVVDENGARLRPQYKRIIEREKALGRLTQINVEKIFSEDASPLLNSGISSIVFPTLIEQAYQEVSEFNKNKFVGGGIWFIDSASHLKDINRNLNSVRGILSTLISSAINEHVGTTSKWQNEFIRNSAHEMTEILNDQKFDVFSPESTKSLIMNRLKHRNIKINDPVDISGSHVVRINLPDSFNGQFLKSIQTAS